MLHIATPEPAIHNRNQIAFVLTVSTVPQTFTSSIPVDVSESIPQSFLEGWADYEASRLVDMDKALEDEPPSV
jgi:hypothetical protein